MHVFYTRLIFLLKETWSAFRSPALWHECSHRRRKRCGQEPLSVPRHLVCSTNSTSSSGPARTERSEFLTIDGRLTDPTSWFETLTKYFSSMQSMWGPMMVKYLIPWGDDAYGISMITYNERGITTYIFCFQGVCHSNKVQKKRLFSGNISEGLPQPNLRLLRNRRGMVREKVTIPHLRFYIGFSHKRAMELTGLLPFMYRVVQTYGDILKDLI